MNADVTHVPWTAVCRAERIRMKGSALQWLPLLGLVVAGASVSLALAAGAQDATGVFWWQGMYLTGMAAPLLGVFAAAAEGREKRAGYGGLPYRSVSPYRIRVGRLLGVLAAVSVFHLLNFGATWVATLFLTGDVSGQLAAVGALALLGSVGTAALGMVLARYLGLVWAVLLLAGWQLAGTVFAKTDWWSAFPPAWPVRLVTPTLGLHANLVPLAPESPLLGEKPWAALVLCLAGAAVMVTVAVLLPVGGLRRRSRRRAIPAKPSGAAPAAPVPAARIDAVGVPPRRYAGPVAVLRALDLVLRRSAVTWLVLATTVLLAGTAWIYPASYVHGLVSFVLLPLGTAVVPMITWRLLAPAWQVAVVENPVVRVAVSVWHVLVIALMCVVVVCCGLLAGGEPVEELRRGLLAMLVGSLLVSVSLVLVIRYSASLAALNGVVWTVVSATLGGDVLAGTWLWLLAPPAWPSTADDPLRVLVAVVLASVMLILALTRVRPALRRQERAA